MARCARRSPDFLEIQQPGIKESPWGIQVSDRRHTPDGKAGLSPDQCGIRFAQVLTGKGAGLVHIHLIASGGDKQDGGTTVLPLKDDGFGDLIDMAAHQISGHLRCRGLSDFNRSAVTSRVVQRTDHTFEAFGHLLLRLTSLRTMSEIGCMTQAPDCPDLCADLLGYETRVWQALQDGDVAADLALLRPDFLGVYPSGFSDRQGHAEQLETGPSLASFDLGDARAFAVGAHHAMLCYLATFTRAGHTEADQMYVSSLWQREGQGWRNLFSQDTPVDVDLTD